MKNWSLVSVWVFVAFQIGFGFWHAISAREFASNSNLFAPVSMVYGLLSGAFFISGLVFIQLARVVSMQERRIRQLEQSSAALEVNRQTSA
jgi:hypothetical protein